MDLGISGKSALVLASTAGLGLACAQRLAREGVHVVINGRDRGVGEKVVRSLGPNARFVSGDIVNNEQRDELLDTVENEFCKPDILVLNGGGPTADAFMDTTLEQWQQGFDQMVLPAISVVQRFIPGMQKHGWGRIISLGSISGKEISIRGTRPNSLRPALVGAMGTLAREVAVDGITVNTILSGPFDTPAMRKVVRQHSGRMDMTTDEAITAYEESGPMKRLGHTDELGSLAAYLASDLAGYITGQAIAIDGGRVATIY